MPFRQSDVVTLMCKEPGPAQHEAFQIIAAYIYCKSSRGNLPGETLSKLISVQRRVSAKKPGKATPTSPLGRAFEAAKQQLIVANSQWHILGPRSLGPLGEIGSASSPDAIWAWTRATDGKVKTFDDGTRGGARAIDAGRVVNVSEPLSAPPPQYVPPPEHTPLTMMSNAPDPFAAALGGAAASTIPDEAPESDTSRPETDSESGRSVRPGDIASDRPAAPPTAPTVAAGPGLNGVDVEAGRAYLARLRAERLKAEEAKEEAASSNGLQRQTEA